MCEYNVHYMSIILTERSLSNTWKQLIVPTGRICWPSIYACLGIQVLKSHWGLHTVSNMHGVYNLQSISAGVKRLWPGETSLNSFWANTYCSLRKASSPTSPFEKHPRKHVILILCKNTLSVKNVWPSKVESYLEVYAWTDWQQEDLISEYGHGA